MLRMVITENGQKTIRIHGITPYSLTDGRGVRFTIFFSGCKHNCLGCHNPHMQDYLAGEDTPFDIIFEQIKMKLDWITGITLSGGDCLFQPNNTKQFLEEFKKIKEFRHLDVWLYTGFLFEQIPKEILKNIDYVIDGKFDKQLPPRKFAGSNNQRIFTKYGNTNKFVELSEKEI